MIPVHQTELFSATDRTEQNEVPGFALIPDYLSADEEVALLQHVETGIEAVAHAVVQTAMPVVGNGDDRVGAAGQVMRLHILRHFAATDAGSYSVVVSNLVTSTVSNDAILTLK